MHEVGLTGGIGSGKSTVARIFQNLGYLVYFADDRAKAVTQSDPQVIAEITAHFGPEMYPQPGELDRKRMAGVVFNDKQQLAVLNSIIHPAVGRDFENWMANLPADYSKSFILKEAAILFEAGTYKDMEAVITVYAPREERIRRVMARDDVAREQVLARMENQLPESFKLQHADFVVYNDGEHLVIPQIMEAAAFFEQKFKA